MSYLENQIAQYEADHGQMDDAEARRDRIEQRQREQSLSEFRVALNRAYGEAQTGEHVSLAEAFAAQAAHFYNPEARFGNDDDADRFYNALGFQQKGFLGNMAQNALWMVENAEKRLDELYTKLDQQEATFDDTEIATRNLNITMDQIERMQVTQLPASQEWLALCKAAYAEIVGEEWKPFVKAGASREKLGAKATLSRAEMLRKRRG